MPPAFKDSTLGEPDNRIHTASPGPERANFRSATPMGFAQAMYSNAPNIKLSILAETRWPEGRQR
jgi:hypothetical protein